MYHYFVSYTVKLNDGNLGYGDAEIKQGYPIATMENIREIKNVLLKKYNNIEELVILNYKLLYKEKQKK